MRKISQLLKGADADRKPIATLAKAARALSDTQLDQVAGSGGAGGIGGDV